MPRILLLLSPALAACTPAPQKAAMPGPVANPETPVHASSGPGSAGRRPDSSEEAQGRRIFSGAFVGMGPDGHMIVELRDGQVLVLRDVVMNPSDYCGVSIADDPAGSKYCGGYADVAAARPGGAAVPDRLNPTPAGPARGSREEP